MVSQDEFINRNRWTIFNRKLGRRLTRCVALNYRPHIDRASLVAQTTRTYEQKYGSIVMMLLISVLADLIVKLIMQWINNHKSEAESSLADWRGLPWPS